jgi:hypothetical protein
MKNEVNNSRLIRLKTKQKEFDFKRSKLENGFIYKKRCIFLCKKIKFIKELIIKKESK